MFEQPSALLADFDMAAAMTELCDRWRAEALAEHAACAEIRSSALVASFEAGAAHLATIRAAQAGIGAQEARRARAIAAFCRSRPASLDRPEHEIGAAAAATRAARPPALSAVSEWAVDEIAVGLSLSESTAARVVVQSLDLVERLPATLAALETGDLTWEHARVVSEVVAPLDDDVREEAELRLLNRLGAKTPSQLRAAAHRVVQRLDAEAVTRRVEAALRGRRVAVHPTGDGLGTLSLTDLPLPVLRAVEDALRRYADAAAVPGDDRTRAQRMADCLVDLVLRPSEHGLAPVQAQLTVVATVGTLRGTDDEPGEVAGDLVPAATVRRLAQSLGLLSAEPTEVEAERTTEPAPAPDPTGGLAALLGARSVTGTALARRPEVALVDELTGQLLALTDAAGLRAGRALGPPPATEGYSPSAPLDRFVRLRDRRCRFPGCRKRPVRCDLDHTVPHPYGPTSHDNLCCLCRHHHRLSHQAPGWTLRGLPDGGLEWTTPTGQVLVTHPARFGADDDLPPPAGHDEADDPPPFRAARRARPTRTGLTSSALEHLASAPMTTTGADEGLPMSEVCARTGLSAHTLRWYEQQELLPPVDRTAGGRRRYRQADLDRLSFLLRLRATGMPVATMRRFAALRRDGEAGRPGRLALLLEHRTAVAQRIATLRENLTAVDAKIDRHRRILRQSGALVSEPFRFRPVHHVQLAIPPGGEDRCRAFWGGVLGMTELEKPPVLAARGGCWFRGGPVEVHLGVEDPFVPARKAHPGLLVDGLPDLARRLEAAGHPVTWDGDFPGHDRCYAADPFGNRLEFLEPSS